jgi:ADP-ribose pyrophosphatase
LFFFGTLCHLPLLHVVLGRAADTEPAQLADYSVSWVQGQAFPMIQPAAGAVAFGILIRGLTETDLARLDFYTGSFNVQKQLLFVGTAEGPQQATVYFPDSSKWSPGKAWQLADWAAVWAQTVVATAGDVMALFGTGHMSAIATRREAMLIRGASRVRAALPTPATLRHAMQPGDVVVEGRSYPYAHFFSVEEYDLRFRRFDGTMSPVINRATFISGDAVTVLPYDPVRDRVLLIEQFRAGPFARGDANAWQLEAIAGRIDPGEGPEAAARREAVEEAGLQLGALLPVAGYYPTPGAKAEFLYSYVALCDLPDGSAGVFGVEGEAEDIRGHLVSFDRLMELVASGEASNAPLVLTALWLQRERGRLRAG